MEAINLHTPTLTYLFSVVWFFQQSDTPKFLFYGKGKGNCGCIERSGHDKQ